LTDLSPSVRLADAQSSFERGNLSGARQAAQLILERYPTSPQAESARSLASRIDSADKVIQKRLEFEEAATKREVATAMASMLKTRDTMRSVTFWQDRAAPRFVNSRSWVGAYIAQSELSPPVLRLRIVYTGENWLFIERYLFKVDGQSFSLTPESYGAESVERDNGSGGIWEWWDVVAEGERLRLLHALADAKSATVRYEGRQYYRDRSIGVEERRAVKRVLTVLDAIAR
jgi:hypothetical protein